MDIDINKRMPKVPGMKWGAMFNWRLEDVEVDSILKAPIFPEDGKWHSVFRDNVNKENKEILVDGRVIRRVDRSKLT